MTILHRPVEYYYDLHPTEEDLMGQSVFQLTLIRYLLELLEQLFLKEGWFLSSDLNLYQTDNEREHPLAPDVAVFIGLRTSDAMPERGEEDLLSWRIAPPERPAPTVVIEIASGKTWEKDLYEKPLTYGRMGVQEYYYYDPRRRRPAGSPRMRGWRYSGQVPEQLEEDEQGRLWSPALESTLVPDGRYLRLHDRWGNRRLTRLETEEAEKLAERAARERLEALLRAHGIDPGLPPTRDSRTP